MAAEEILLWQSERRAAEKSALECLHILHPSHEHNSEVAVLMMGSCFDRWEQEGGELLILFCSCPNGPGVLQREKSAQNRYFCVLISPSFGPAPQQPESNIVTLDGIG